MELDDFLNVGEYLRGIPRSPLFCYTKSIIYQRFIELYNRIKIHH